MAAKKTLPRPPAAKECAPCKGTGEVAVSVRIGRKRRVVGQQNGLCLNCLGTGEAPTD
ncbi:hypothetical protein ACFVTY_22725 [Streptomyces sp. NPDC058067]|uniref:hypothetical protein n=1 Tax=Streptomyces sp. NPDC058067 TaxID=3346324 RepID=UPI0036DFCE05